MKITKTAIGATIDLNWFSDISYVDILSVHFGQDFDNVVIKVCNWHIGLTYSIANTRVGLPDFDRSWEITLEPYREPNRVVSGLTAEEVLQKVEDAVFGEFLDEPKSYTEPVDDDYKAYLADND